MHAAFGAYDKDQSGFIDMAELKEVCFRLLMQKEPLMSHKMVARLNLPITDSALADLLEYVDADHNGKVRCVRLLDITSPSSCSC
jgi:Ca2+-binding EF-hand superfamily protein